MAFRKLLILGGTGFVGRSLAARWAAEPAAAGCAIVVPSRRPSRGVALATLPTVQRIAADVHDPATLERLMQGADAVVNLVAILHGSAAQFEAAHVVLPQRIAAACLRAGVPRLLHVSALGVPEGDPQSAPSRYLRSKAA